MKVQTWQILAPTTKSATFQSSAVDIIQDAGFSVSITVTAESSIDVAVTLEGSAAETTSWATIENSSTAVTGNTVLIYNVPDAFYKEFRVVVTFTGGSADFQIDVTTKGC